MDAPHIPARMRAIVVEGGKGPADALKIAEIPTPEPKAGEILVRVAAAGVNFADTHQRKGNYPPPPGAPETIGMEISGTVVRAAKNGRFEVGDPVCALLGGGGYAEYAAFDERHALPIPRGVSLPDAAALPETIFTVYANVFETGKLKAGETFLIHGATSGIGVTAIAMAKAAGARVIATGRGDDKARRARDLGADLAIDSTAEDFESAVKGYGGADVILDMVGADYTQKNLNVLREDGRLCQIAFMTGAKMTLDLGQMLRKRITFAGSTLRNRSPDDKARLAREVERTVWPWVETGKVSIVIDRVFPLADAASAHTYLESGRHVGKILLSI